MKIVAISDTHDQHRQIEIPPCDVLIVAGDFTCHRQPRWKDYTDFNSWLGEQPAKYKIVVAGNHDMLLRDAGLAESKVILSNATYLQDEGIEINGVKFWGSPWTPEFAGWAFMKQDEHLVRHWQMIPGDTDVLITHGPPYGILDENLEGQHCGSVSLKKALVRPNLKHHIFGHIHESFGSAHEYVGKVISFHNVSQTDRMNDLVNKPVVIEI